MSASIALDTFIRVLPCPEEAPPLRLTLLPEEQLRLPPRPQRLRVLSGTAWLSYAGKDHILEGGASFRLPPRRRDAILSATGAGELRLEIAEAREDHRARCD